MKSQTLLILVSALLLFSSCTTITRSLYDSPNNMSNVKSTLYLKNGRTISGRLTINTEHKKHNKISIQTSDYNAPQRFKLKNVKGYAIDGDYYSLQQVNDNTIVIEKGNPLLEQLLTKKKYFFMKRITPENSRIHLYENHFIKAARDEKPVNATRVIEYYIQLPSNESKTVYAIDGKKLLPHFENKMSKIVNDCPDLAFKIAQRQPGYFYARQRAIVIIERPDVFSASEDQKVAVLMNIINEYNRCK